MSKYMYIIDYNCTYIYIYVAQTWTHWTTLFGTSFFWHDRFILFHFLGTFILRFLIIFTIGCMVDFRPRVCTSMNAA